MTRAAAEIDGCSIGLQRAIDAPELQLNVRNRREMKRTLNGQQMRAADFVALDETIERSIEVAHCSVQVREVVLRVDELFRILPERWHGERFLQPRSGAIVIAHGAQNVAEVREIERDGDMVVALAIECEHAPGNLERFLVPPLMPSQKAETPQRACKQRPVAAFLTNPQSGRKRSIGRIESLEQRGKISLAKVDLGEPRGSFVTRKLRDQRVDDLLLSRAKAQRFAHTLLLKQKIGEKVGLLAGQAARPLDQLVENCECIAELTQFKGSFRRATAEPD